MHWPVQMPQCRQPSQPVPASQKHHTWSAGWFQSLPAHGLEATERPLNHGLQLLLQGFPSRAREGLSRPALGNLPERGETLLR